MTNCKSLRRDLKTGEGTRDEKRQPIVAFPCFDERKLMAIAIIDCNQVWSLRADEGRLTS